MSNILLNSALQSAAIASLGAALDSGLKAEQAIVDTVRTISFLALDKIGREQKAGELPVGGLKMGSAFNTPYTIVLKALIFKGKMVYRDSAVELAAVRQIPASKKAERVEAVNAYIKACKGRDVVWTIGQVRSLASKVVTKALTDYRNDVVTIATMENEEAQLHTFAAFFRDFVGGDTYSALKARFAKEGDGTAADPVEAIGKSVEKLTDADKVRAIIERATAHLASIEKAAARVAKLNGGAPAPTEEDDGDVEVDNVVQLAA